MRERNYCFRPPSFEVVSFAAIDNCQSAAPKTALYSTTSFPDNVMCASEGPGLSPYTHIHLPYKSFVSDINKPGFVLFTLLRPYKYPPGSRESWAFILMGCCNSSQVTQLSEAQALF